MPRIVTIKAPLGGQVNATGFQDRPPFTSNYTVNMWPIDAKTGRAVLATRPSLTRFGEISDPVNMIAPISGVKTGQPFNSLAISIDGTLYWFDSTGNFTVATGAEAAGLDTDVYLSAAAVVNELFICRADDTPLVFNYPAGTVTEPVATGGSFPTDCRIAVNYQGALWLSGKVDSDSHIIHASRVGDPYDWDYAADVSDQFGPFYSDTEYRGVLSGPVTALIPHTADRLVVSTYSGMLAMYGHPRQGGIFQPIGTTYVLGQNAWCRVPGDVLFMMTPNGLMSLDPSANAVPVQVSRDRIPEELVNLPYDYENPTCCLVYDSRWNCVHIFVTKESGPTSWIYDLKNGGFHQMIFPTDAYTACQFDQIATVQSGSVLVGTPSGLFYYDRFGEEPIASDVNIGPIKMSQTAAVKARLDKLSVVFGRDTPLGPGTLSIAAGRDGQDAVERMNVGGAQFSIDIEALRDNNGVCFPKVAGHAMVVRITADEGDVVIEEMVAEFEEAGTNRLDRVPQTPVLGNALEFSEGQTEFDDDTWVGYTENTPPAADENMPDYTFFVDLSELSSEWWGFTKPNGGDIRVTDNQNNQLPMHLIHFDYANQTGLLAFKGDASTTPTPFRIWNGRYAAAQPAVDAEFGQYNTYDDNWRVFWPDGGGTDVTQYGNDATTTAFITEGDQDGPSGTLATDYTGDDQASARIATFFTVANPDLVGLPELSLITLGRMPVAGANSLPVIALDGGTATDRHFVTGRVASSPTIYTQTNFGNGSAETANTGTATNWSHFAGVLPFSDKERAMFNGGTAAASSIASGITNSDANSFRVGGSALPNSAPAFYLGMSQMHTTARSDAWVSYQSDMLLDNGTFWGPWDDYSEENPGGDEPTYDPVACPLGEVVVSETGTWSGYVELTPSDEMLALPNFTCFLDLAQMPASFWSAVKADGTDIRATDQANIFVPFDLIEFNKTAETGLLAFMLAPNASLLTKIRIWAGNATAVTVDECARYGQYNAYDDNWIAFWPDGGGNDRTQYRNHLTGYEGLNPGGAAGPIGNTATGYSTGRSTRTYYNQTREGAATFIEPGLGIFTDDTQTEYTGFGVIGMYKMLPLNWDPAVRSLQKVFHVGETYLEPNNPNVDPDDPGDHYPGQPNVLQFPNYLYTKMMYGNQGIPTIGSTIARNDTSITDAVPGEWFTASAGNLGYYVYTWCNDSSDPDDQTRGLTLGKAPSNKTLIQIGNLRPGYSPYNGANNFRGYISMLGIRNVTISIAYTTAYYSMMDQVTLWGALSWTASSSSLPQ